MSEAAKLEAPQKRSLVKKLAEIMGEVQRVPKSGRNEFHKYDYATEADILDAVRDGMAKRSVILLPSVVKTEFKEMGKQQLCTLTVDFTVEDGDTGETRVLTFIGQGADNLDKATYKAMTGAEKYVLLKLFMIPTGDDPEKEEAPQPKRQQQAPQQAAQPSRVTGRGALKERLTRLWARANGAGWAPDKFKAWKVETLQGLDPSMEEIDAAQVDALEKAWEAKFSKGAA
jgi:hypothetical protein